MNIIEFFKTNIILVVSIFIMIVNFITMIITISKNPKKVASYLVSALQILPSIIVEAENLGFTSGEVKKVYVVKQTISYLISLTGWNEAKVVNIFSSSISTAIENILACPQKKGA